MAPGVTSTPVVGSMRERQLARRRGTVYDGGRYAFVQRIRHPEERPRNTPQEVAVASLGNRALDRQQRLVAAVHLNSCVIQGEMRLVDRTVVSAIGELMEDCEAVHMEVLLQLLRSLAFDANMRSYMLEMGILKRLQSLVRLAAGRHHSLAILAELSGDERLAPRLGHLELWRCVRRAATGADELDWHWLAHILESMLAQPKGIACLLQVGAHDWLARLLEAPDVALHPRDRARVQTLVRDLGTCAAARNSRT